MKLLGKRLGRRTFLRGAGGVAVGLPFLDAMLGAGPAAAVEFPKRFLMFFTPNGYYKPYWTAQASGTSLTGLAGTLAPLEPYRGDLVVLNEVNNQAGVQSDRMYGQAHDCGIACLLSGTELIPRAGGNGCTTNPNGTAGGPTIDQVLANHIGAGTRFKSVQFGFTDGNGCRTLGGAGIQENLVYAASGQPVPPIEKPGAAFQRLFASGAGSSLDPGAAERLRARKQSILDTIREDASRLAARLGPGDRQRVDQVMTSIRGIEQRLAMAAPVESCRVPAAPTPTLADGLTVTFQSGDYIVKDQSKMPACGRLFMDMLALAAACDLTRVSSLQFGPGGDNRSYAFTGLNYPYHWHTDSDRLSLPDAWFNGELAYLLKQLKDIPEGGGSLLDNILVMRVSDMGTQGGHDLGHTPYILAGRAGGTLATGKVFNLAGRKTNNNLYLSILQKFGVAAQTFGNPAYCTGGPLAELA